MLTIRLALYIFYNTVQSKLDSSRAIRAGDAWIGQLAMFISRRCSLFRWSAVFRRCRHHHTGIQIATWRRSLTRTRHDFSHDLRPLLMGKMFVWLPAFLTEPGSARYSSAPSITTVWSNYQTSYNDFFEVYNSNTVTLSPIIEMVRLTSSVLSMSVTWPIILRPHWSNRLPLW